MIDRWIVGTNPCVSAPPSVLKLIFTSFYADRGYELSFEMLVFSVLGLEFRTLDMNLFSGYTLIALGRGYIGESMVFLGLGMNCGV